jgi:hypothetical protein
MGAIVANCRPLSAATLRRAKGELGIITKKTASKAGGHGNCRNRSPIAGGGDADRRCVVLNGLRGNLFTPP